MKSALQYWFKMSIQLQNYFLSLYNIILSLVYNHLSNILKSYFIISWYIHISSHYLYT